MRMINALVLLAVGCGEPEKSGQADTQTISISEDTAQSTDDQPADLDGDGYGDNDCDDTDASIYPGASEIPDDGIDQDCNGHDLKSACEDSCEFALDGECDDGGTDAAYDLCDLGTDCSDCGARFDGDADGFFDLEDCDDNDSSVNPDAIDIGNDGIDQDCDGLDFTGLCDDSCPYPSDGDCDDGGSESLFDLCDLGTDCSDCGPRWDADGDGYDSGEDCMDDNLYVNPGAADDTCDGIDDNCNGIPDDQWTGDGYEPNDDEAYDLESLTASESIDLYAYITHKDDVDSFMFSMVDEGWGPDFGLKVFVDGMPADMDIRLQILKDGQEIRNINDNGPGGFEIVALSDDLGEEDGGLYTVVVSSVSGASCAQSYHLSILETGW